MPLATDTTDVKKSQDVPRMEPINAQKVAQYEHFLNETLRSDLETTLERRDKIYEQIAEYNELSVILGTLDGHEGPKLRTKVDIGCNFYVQAEIENCRNVIVDVGCGIWVEMNETKAKEFCEKKTKFLNKQAEQLTMKEVKTKAEIDVVLEGLKEIQGIKQFQPKSFDSSF